MDSKTFRVFVGTMFCGENEFLLSQQSLDKQKHVLVERFVVRNLPEEDAAKKLYNTWNQVKEFYDFFVQLDPDVVLAHDSVLYDACTLLSHQIKVGSEFTSLQAPLYDFLSDTEMMGLNVYSTLVEFGEPPNRLFTDRCKTNVVTLTQNFSSFPQSLIPAGEHSPNPSLEQAFHYGIHRGLKGQISRYNAVKDAHNNNPSIERAMALIGFHCYKFFIRGGFNYNEEPFKYVFEQVKMNVMSTFKHEIQYETAQLQII